MKVTRVAYSRDLNRGKLAALTEQARRLGRVRAQVWQRYGPAGGARLSDRQVRDAWMAAGYTEFGVLANTWKETLRDAMGDIRAGRDAAKLKVRRAISHRTTDPAERKRLFTALKTDEWATDPYLSRMMRKHWRHGHSHTTNQIIIRADNVRTFTLAEGGDVHDVDHAAAINILQRASDPGITLHTPHRRVKQILRERADRQRARLPAQDSSPATGSGERNIPICSGVSNE